ncbi:hypothetical protein Acr_18g0000630 [Actinidia rufa]|uniref:Uncharacterized protein n=1 Tax=Actinidia rufa TaxID=165716 RepID=A0A7J0G538_9ERIC|nr:hypothetical protein Acr_18g0000630 [Actinidia rufa]
MAEESQKRFHAIMDKLFHAPPKSKSKSTTTTTPTGSASSSGVQQLRVEKSALVFSLKLDNGYKLLCPWIDNACDEKLAQFLPIPAVVLVDEYKKHSSVLLNLLALPVISSSTIDYMRSPQLEHFLRGSSIVGGSSEPADTSQNRIPWK